MARRAMQGSNPAAHPTPESRKILALRG